MIQKLNIKVRVNEQRKKNDKFPIYIRIYVDGKKTEISTCFFIDKNEWDNKKEKVNSSCQIALEINTFLDSARNKIQKEFLGAVAQEKKDQDQLLGARHKF